MRKKKVLISISNYLPGFKMGGPLNSILNIVNNLNDRFEFYILTSDRDFGENQPYEGIEINTWQQVGNAKVMYVRGTASGFIDIYKVLKSNSFDTVYLNSFFEFKFSIYPATLKFLRLVRLGNTVVAPRGEFYDEALNFKSKKKELFLKVIRSIGVYKRVTWHSTETGESKEIEKLFGGHARIAEARVLSDFSNVIKHSYDVKFETEISTLKIVFLSRISKDKNVPYIFDVLEKVSRPLEIHFYGPIEDEDIWEECLDKMKHLPENIVAKYKGPVVKKDVKGVFSKYDMFFLPTHRENFGHVISESLSVGTPVLISTNTPWQNLASHGLGWDNDLNHMQDFVNVLTSYEINGEKDREIKRMNVIDKFNSYMNIEETINENVNLFSK